MKIDRHLLVCVLLSLVMLAGCSGSDKEIKSIRSMAGAQVNIERMRKEKIPDWEKIAAQYEIIAPLVVATDKAYGLNYDRDIRTALKKCTAGEKSRVNQQILAKGLQHVVVLNIEKELNGNSSSKAVGSKVAAYFDGIRPTFTRRDKDFFNSQKTLEAAADRALDQLNGSKEVPLTVARELKDAIDRTYGLSVLYEIMSVEKLRDTALEDCEVKVKEAEIFYRIIQPRIAKNDARADQVISNMLAAGYGAMDAATLEQHLNRGLDGITLR